MGSSDILSAERIQSTLTGNCARLFVDCRNEVTSTNSILKGNTSEDERVLLALSQTAGRGRLGRSFFSPPDTGLYLSLRLKKTFSDEHLPLITPAAAVAACHAVESVSGSKPQIKWVNDLILNNRKICGILTELISSPAGDSNLIIGVGINVYAPIGGFPDEISGLAGYISSQRRENLRNELAAAFINSFVGYYDNIDKAGFIDEYIAKSCVIGKRINVISSGIVRTAYAIGIDRQCRLLVRYDDGTADALYSGEISIRTI